MVQNTIIRQPLILALIPAHNEQDVIGQTLMSLQQQTIRPHCTMVIADNCSDNTIDIARGQGAQVLETVRNTDKKAGAVGGVFRGGPGGGFVGHLQRNEYARYARDVRRLHGKCLVVTGTAALFRARTLRVVSAAAMETRGAGELFPVWLDCRDAPLLGAAVAVPFRHAHHAGLLRSDGDCTGDGGRAQHSSVLARRHRCFRDRTCGDNVITWLEIHAGSRLHVRTGDRSISSNGFREGVCRCSPQQKEIVVENDVQQYGSSRSSRNRVRNARHDWRR